MEVLLIGGTGNVSSSVAEELARRGHEVTLLTTGRRPVPKEFRHIQADRHDEKALAAALKDCRMEAVIDFAAFKPEHCVTAWRVLRGQLRQFIFISTAAVYEKPPKELPITEQTPLGNPYWDYARQKADCENYFGRVHGPEFPVTIVRPSHTFGPSWIPSPINRSDYTVAARIVAGRPVIVHGDGQSLWTLTASSDFAAGLAGLVGNDKALGEAFHITQDQVLTWNAIYHEIGLALGREPRIVHIPTEFLAEAHPPAIGRLIGDKANDAVFDNAKIKRFAPDFECRKSFRTAIRESVAWYDEDESRKRIDPEQDKLIDSLIERWAKERG